jgi:hypothetical protein
MPSITRFAISHLLCQRFGNFQPGVNKIHIHFRRGDSAFALFLETMKNKNRLLKLYSLNGAICAASIVFDDFKNAVTTKARQDFSCRMLVAVLCEIQGMPKEPHHIGGKGDQVSFAAPDPNERFFGTGHGALYMNRYITPAR